MVIRHAVKNALIPVVSVIGLQIRSPQVVHSARARNECDKPQHRGDLIRRKIHHLHALRAGEYRSILFEHGDRQRQPEIPVSNQTKHPV